MALKFLSPGPRNDLTDHLENTNRYQLYIFFNFKEIIPEGQDSESTCSASSPVQGKKPFYNTIETKPSSNLLFSKQITHFLGRF